MKRQLALAEQIADIHVGPIDEAPRTACQWDRAFVEASSVGLKYAIQILGDKAETDCDNATRYNRTIGILRKRIEYIAVNGYPVNRISDECVGWEIDRFQVWLMEQDPEIQAIMRETEDNIAALAAEKGVTLDEAILLWNGGAAA